MAISSEKDAAAREPLAAWGGHLASALIEAIDGRSSAPEASRLAKGKKPRAMRLRTREELIDAVRRRDLKKVHEAIDSGLNPSFVEPDALDFDFRWLPASPLCVAVASGWTEGVEALLARGADEERARQDYLEAGPKNKAAERLKDLTEADHYAWATNDDADLMALLMNALQSDGLKKLVASNAIRGWATAEWLLDNAQAHWLSQDEWGLAEKKGMARIANRSAQDIEEGLRVMSKIWSAFPELLESGKEFRWGMAVASDNVKLLGFFAKKEIPAPKNAMGDLVQANFGRAKSFSPNVPPEIEVDHHYLDLDSESIGYSEKDPALRVPLWALAIAVEAPNSLKLLGKIEGLAQAALAHPETTRVASYCSDMETLKEAQAQGLALAQCVSSDGETPMRRAFAPGGTLEQKRSWARLCPEWLSVRMSARKSGQKTSETPVDILRRCASRLSGAEGRRMEKLAVDLEAMALKKTVKDVKKEMANQEPAGKSKKPAIKRAKTRRL